MADLKQWLLKLKPNVIPFLLGAAFGWVVTDALSTDPNRGWDPQAETGFTCDRAVIRRVPGGVHSWSAVAYDVDCGFIGNFSIIYVYLLHPGQTISQSTLVVSYQGSDPELEWKNASTLTVHTEKVSEVWKKVVSVGGVVVKYEFPPGF